MFLFRDSILDTNREIRVALQQIYGVGWRKSILVTSKIGLSYPFYLNKINAYNFSILVFLLKFLVISDVRIKRRIEFDISKMVDTNSVKGLRHQLCLPVHGQRTRTNARTQRVKRQRRREFINSVNNAKANKKK